MPQIDAGVLPQCRQFEKRLQVESRVAERIRSREFEGLAAVGFNLRVHSPMPGGFDGLPREIGVADKQGQMRDLNVIKCAVIIFGGLFVPAVRTGLGPMQKLYNPGIESVVVGLAPMTRTFEQSGGAPNAGEAPALDHARGASRGDARD